MRIVGGAQVGLARMIARHRPDHVVSILSPGECFPVVSDRRHLRLQAHDVCEPSEGLSLADESFVENLIAFVSEPPCEGCIVIHCSLGVSRSPAAALVAACALRPHADPHALAQRFRTASPVCTPNRRIAELGDGLLGLEGRLLAAVTAMGRGRTYNGPETFKLEF